VEGSEVARGVHDECPRARFARRLASAPVLKIEIHAVRHSRGRQRVAATSLTPRARRARVSLGTTSSFLRALLFRYRGRRQQRGNARN
jgi:hypothetical protein